MKEAPVTKEQRHKAQVDATRFNRVHQPGDPCEVTVSSGHVRRTTLKSRATVFSGRVARAYVDTLPYSLPLTEIRMLPKETT